MKNQIGDVGSFIYFFSFVLQINLKDNGDMYKTHIGHDNSRKDPRWYLEEIKLENIELFCLPVDSWIAENENGAIHGRKCPL